MQRHVPRLSSGTFDVLVVGGGIYGLTIAADAAGRGLSVAVIDRGDFGGGSSFNHLRTIHGGLRYLQALDLPRARQSVRERRTLARIAPHAVRPLPFALPLYRSLAKGRLAMRAGLLVDRAIGWDRNRRVPPPLHLPAGQVLSREAAIERFPGLSRKGLTGAVVWHDYTTPESDRLTVAWMESAARHGAVLANYVEATAPLLDGTRVVGVRAEDRQTSTTLEIAARMTINAAGASVNLLPARAGVPDQVLLLKAMNLVTRRDAGDEALGARAPSGRHLFLVPWRRHALFGTWESSEPCSEAGATVREAEIASFVDELNRSFPALDLNLDDVTLVHRGLVPARRVGVGAVALEGRQQVLDHGERPGHLEGLITVAGTKYTTARAVAELVVDRVIRKLGRPPVPCRTAITPLPGGDVPDLAATIAEARRDYDVHLPSDAVPHLVAAYGSRYRDLLALVDHRPDLGAAVSAAAPVIGAELVWAVRHEMAITLADAVIRRTPLGALGDPGEVATARAADIVGAELGWSTDQRWGEVEAVRRFYVW